MNEMLQLRFKIDRSVKYGKIPALTIKKSSSNILSQHLSRFFVDRDENEIVHAHVQEDVSIFESSESHVRNLDWGSVQLVARRVKRTDYRNGTELR